MGDQFEEWNMPECNVGLDDTQNMSFEDFLPKLADFDAMQQNDTIQSSNQETSGHPYTDILREEPKTSHELFMDTLTDDIETRPDVSISKRANQAMDRRMSQVSKSPSRAKKQKPLNVPRVTKGILPNIPISSSVTMREKEKQQPSTSLPLSRMMQDSIRVSQQKKNISDQAPRSLHNKKNTSKNMSSEIRIIPSHFSDTVDVSFIHAPKKSLSYHIDKITKETDSLHLRLLQNLWGMCSICRVVHYLPERCEYLIATKPNDGILQNRFCSLCKVSHMYRTDSLRNSCSLVEIARNQENVLEISRIYCPLHGVMRDITQGCPCGHLYDFTDTPDRNQKIKILLLFSKRGLITKDGLDELLLKYLRHLRNGIKLALLQQWCETDEFLSLLNYTVGILRAVGGLDPIDASLFSISDRLRWMVDIQKNILLSTQIYEDSTYSATTSK